MAIKIKKVEPDAGQAPEQKKKIKPKSNGRGGKRKGAGRPIASTTRKTREIAERAAEKGITPLEVILEAMEHFRNIALAEAAKGEKADTAQISAAYKDAKDAAKDAAPYVHPRLAAVEVSGPGGKPIEVSSPLDRIERSLERIARAATSEPAAE